MKKSVSSTDVAREAGVSRATVSYILNNIKDVKIKPETRERVIEAARKLGYHPDATARALKTKRSMSIGVVSGRDAAEERFAKVLSGIREVLKKNKYSVVLCNNEMNSKGYPEYYSYYHEKKIDGVLFLADLECMCNSQVEKTVNTIMKEKIPAVFIDYHLNNPEVNCVDINYYHGAYIAARHMIEKGHKKIIYYGPDFDTVQENDRLKGVKQACMDAGLDADHLKAIKSGRNNREFFEAVTSIIQNKEDFNALIVSWRHIAFKTLYIANEMGVKIPDEMELISLGGSDFADYTYPMLSTSDLPLHEIGRKSADVLLDLLKNDSLPVNITLPCSLNIRETC